MNDANNLPVVQVNNQVSVMEVEPISSQVLLRQVAAISDAMKSLMKEDVHYGKIPGTDKPTLLQPGAQKIGLMFRLAPHFHTEVLDLPSGHREVRVTCTLMSPNGTVVGQGIGVCSTMESKYRYRGTDFLMTEVSVPRSYWDSRDNEELARLTNSTLGTSYTAKQVQAKKNDAGSWYVAIRGEKKENPDIADTYNTVHKMAAKRAHVHSILAATGASDMFTQDMEDIVAEPIKPGFENRAEKPAAPPNSPPPQTAVPQSWGGEQKTYAPTDYSKFTYRYAFPREKAGYDMDAIRALAKAKKCRWNPDDKTWYAPSEIPELAEFRKENKLAQQAPPQQRAALSPGDDLPPWNMYDGEPNV